jgi:hydrogenase maturation protease
VAQRVCPEKTPKRVYLVGIEGKCFDELGAGLTEEVAEAVDGAVKEVMNLVEIQ